MDIVKAKSAGFCFGVDRAVQLTYRLLNEGRRVATLGPLIHNPQCIADLENKGAVTAQNIERIPQGCEVVIRSHGVPRAIYDELTQKNFIVHDATCPFVRKIQKIARRCGEEGKTLLIAGDAGHPEVQGIVGNTSGEVFVFAELSKLENWLTPENAKKDLVVVAQTTFEVKKWLECRDFLKKVCTNPSIFDTICNATWARQQEAEELSRRCDLMIVIGGRHSSNTQKLFAVAAKHTKAVLAETAKELTEEMFRGVRRAGVTAGASTPSPIIEEVLSKMSEVNHEENMNFGEMLEQSFNTPVYRNKEVRGTVISVTPSEAIVDIGAKSTGIVHISEMTDDPSAKMEDLVKKGDELDLVVMKVNDQEGTTQLSRKRLEASKGQEEAAKACEDGTEIEVLVTEAVKGGLVALYKGLKVFIPASQATLRRGEDYSGLVRKKVNIKIIECSGRRVIGSVRAVLSAVADAAKEKFWSDVEVGKHYTGVVKSLMNYGAFVDIGGVDGLVHISELSWNRIKHPSEVVSVGDEIEVYVKDLDVENKKVSLGYKKTEDDPWAKFKSEYPIGTVFTAPVVSITKFGAFVRILPGIDGLVHISEISRDRVEKVSDVLTVGQEVTVKLIGVDFDNKRISLSMKALQEPVEDEENAAGSDEE